MSVRRIPRWWVAASIVVALVGACRWAEKGMGHFEYQGVSPHHMYRVEVWMPSVFAIFRAWHMESPGFVRVYDNRTDKLLAESGIYDMFGNGEIFWPSKTSPELMVGNGDDAYIIPLPPEPDD